MRSIQYVMFPSQRPVYHVSDACLPGDNQCVRMHCTAMRLECACLDVRYWSDSLPFCTED